MQARARYGVDAPISAFVASLFVVSAPAATQVTAGERELDANRPAILHIKVTGRVPNLAGIRGEPGRCLCRTTVRSVRSRRRKQGRFETSLPRPCRSLRDADRRAGAWTRASIPRKIYVVPGRDTVPALYLACLFTRREPATTYNWKNTCSVPYSPQRIDGRTRQKKINDVFRGAWRFGGDPPRRFDQEL